MLTYVKAEGASAVRLTQINCGAADSRRIGLDERVGPGDPMRFYFDINDKLPIRDQVGRDFGLVSEDVVFATYLAADLRCLEPDIRPQLSVRVIGEGLEQIHEEAVLT